MFDPIAKESANFKDCYPLYNFVFPNLQGYLRRGKGRKKERIKKKKEDFCSNAGFFTRNYTHLA